MKRPTAASLKKVTPGNLEALGPERLATILFDLAQGRPDVKRRLRMELAAHQGAEPLAAEIDKRLGSMATSRGKIGWRQRPGFVGEVDGLRLLITERLASLDKVRAAERMWMLMRLGAPTLRRMTDKDGSAAEMFSRAAGDLGRLIAMDDVPVAAATLATAIATGPIPWAGWLPSLLASAPAALAEAVLAQLSLQRGGAPGLLTIVRMLAIAADDVDAYVATFPVAMRAAPGVAADIASRYLAAGRLGEARATLTIAAPGPIGRSGRLSAPDFLWETVWIDYLDRAGEGEAAQAVRWSSFERTLSGERLRAFTSRLADFDDVEAEGRAFGYAARHPDFEAALRLLVGWPALAEAGAMILARPAEIIASSEDAELWAGKLRARQPAAALLLLRKAAAAAFRRREFKICDRLTTEGDAIDVERAQ